MSCRICTNWMPESRCCCLGLQSPIAAGCCEAFEEILLPKTHWTKTRMLEVARIGGLDQRSLDIMSLVSLDDMLQLFLIKRCTVITGSPKDPKKQRHTSLYALDWRFIRHYCGVDCQ